MRIFLRMSNGRDTESVQDHVLTETVQNVGQQINGNEEGPESTLVQKLEDFGCWWQVGITQIQDR